MKSWFSLCVKLVKLYLELHWDQIKHVHVKSCITSEIVFDYLYIQYKRLLMFNLVNSMSQVYGWRLGCKDEQ